MSFGEDEEILQDFLVEAGEIIELLSEQLVDLEQRPDDKDLLNAIFRGFHTVKGGAGFLQLNALVDCCHITENLFDLLRNGKLVVSTELMDVVLQALDAVNDMFTDVQERRDPAPADPALIDRLEQLVESANNPQAAPVVEEPVAPVAPTLSSESAPSGGDLSDAEFEQFLDAIQDGGEGAPTASAPAATAVENTAPDAGASAGNEITDDEFESLLDDIHGKGKHGGASAGVDSTTQEASEPSTASSASSNDEISEAEFDALLDELHGGKAPGKTASVDAASSAGETGSSADSGLIGDNEFDSLMDQLHGAGKGPTVQGGGPQASPAENKNKDPAPAQVPEAQPVAAAQPVVAKAETKKAPPAAEKPAASKVTAASKSAAAAKPKRPQKETVATETTVRVDTQRLDEIMNMVGELVLVRNRLVRLGVKSGDEAMVKAVSNLDVVTADLQTSVMKTRMQPIKKVFGRFPRVVRDLARNLKKEISLELQGEDTDLDKNLVEALADPLVHLVRNSVDHGIEMPDIRDAAGKSRAGKVILAAEQEGDHILLSITDDGAGMDPEKLRGIAVDKGLFDEDSAARLSDSECFNLIFMPGFSTKKEISDVSGRGVGMDVVKTKISQLNGSIDIQSKIGEGTRIAIKVPLTLAIMPTLMVMLGQQTFALPLVSVNEIFHMDLTRTNIVDGQEVVTVREKALPLFYLRRWLVNGSAADEQSDNAHVVIVSVGTQRVGFVVDQLVGQEEVVIKPLGKMLQGTPGMAGATITGDGRIALILDVPSMLKRYAS